MQKKPVKIVLSIVAVFVFLMVSLSMLSYPGIDSTMSSPNTEIRPEKQHLVAFNPQNDQAPVLQNPDDTDNMYAMLRNYQITAYVSVPDGYAAIEYIDLWIYNDARTQNYTILRYNENTNSFSDIGGTGYVILQTGLCSAIRSGNDIDATFVIQIDWDHPDVSNVDVWQYVYDYNATSDADWYEVNWDIETRLNYTSTPSITSDDGGTVDRGDLDEAFHMTGTIVYLGSTTSPISSGVDVWVSASQYGVNVGPWIDATLTAGAFDVTCYADNLVGMDTYTVKVVPDGAGSGASDLYIAASVTDTYIADRIRVQSYSVADNRVNIGTSVYVYVTLVYEYLSQQVTTGTVTINGISANHQGGGVWRITDSETSATGNTYNTVACSSDIHRVATVNQNGQSQLVIWDSLTIFITDPASRINVNANASGIHVSAIRDYDSAVFDGTLTLNDTTFQYSSVGRHGYRVASASGGSYGITAIRLNDATACIWDSLTITMLGPTDSRININTNALGIIATAVHDFDGLSYDGTLTLNDTTFLYLTVGRRGYRVSSASGGSYPLVTMISLNDATACIWDSLTISISDPTDQRISINENAIGIIATAVYDYDSASFDGTLTFNETAFLFSTVGRRGYTVATASGDSYGISVISANDETYCIWDSLTITITDPTDQRININEEMGAITTSAIYDYDGTIYDGTLTLNDTTTHSTAGKRGFTVATASGDTYGITAIGTNDETYCIWDSLTVTITDPTDQRINIGSTLTGLIVSAVYDYDGTDYDGTLTLNDTTTSYSTVGKRGYTVSSASGDSYGVTAISFNDETYVIWDSLSVSVTCTRPMRVNVNANASGIVVSATYDYDGAVFDGELTLNSTTFFYLTVGRRGYAVTSASGDSYGITAISTSVALCCIWDRLVISIEIEESEPESEHEVEFSLDVTFEYDGEACTSYEVAVHRNGEHWKTFTHENSSTFVDSNTEGEYVYEIASVNSESLYGITAFTSTSVPVTWQAQQISPLLDESTVELVTWGSIFVGGAILIFRDPARLPPRRKKSDVSAPSIETEYWDQLEKTDSGKDPDRPDREYTLKVILNEDKLNLQVKKDDVDASTKIQKIEYGKKVAVEPSCDICDFKPEKQETTLSMDRPEAELVFQVSPQKLGEESMSIRVTATGEDNITNEIGIASFNIKVQPHRLQLKLGGKKYAFSKKTLWLMYIPSLLFMGSGLLAGSTTVGPAIEILNFLNDTVFGFVGTILTIVSVITFVVASKPSKILEDMPLISGYIKRRKEQRESKESTGGWFRNPDGTLVYREESEEGDR